MTIRALVVAMAAALALAACSQQDDATPAVDDPTQGSAAELTEFSPLTGLEMTQGRPDNPVFVVKIENTSAGKPQLNLDRADLVIEELVEGGLTRLAAFYYTDLPTKVGHVRSLRSTDIGIATPANGQLVASGGAGGAVGKIKRAGITLFSEDAGSPGFSSDPNLSRPYNRLIDLTRVNKEAKNTQPKMSYLEWSPAGETSDPGTSTVSAASRATVRFSRSTTTSWKFSGSSWKRTNGHADKEFKAKNLIVMECQIQDAGYTDPAGNPVPETVVEGSGTATIFRGSEVVEVTWNKPALDSPITFTTADGLPYTVAPGKTFVELVPEDDGKVTFEP
ncbi:MAG: DUF3048 domain-containing protein [Aeromicrobium sp.]